MTGSKFYKLKQAGFTLVEAVVAVGIFVIVMVTVVDVYLVYSRAQNIAQQRQKVLSEVGFALERIAQDIRVGEIQYQGDFDYGSGSVAYYSLDGDSGISGQEIELVLVDANGNNVIYVFDDTGDKVCPDFTTKGIYKYTGTVCEPVFNLPEMAVIEAGFYISPSYNPYPDSDSDCKNGTFNGYYCSCSVNSDCYSDSCIDGFCDPVNQQPRVTIFMVVEDSSDVTVKEFTIQTTASGRIYKR